VTSAISPSAVRKASMATSYIESPGLLAYRANGARPER
jgi:hypothetical protein